MYFTDRSSAFLEAFRLRIVCHVSLAFGFENYSGVQTKSYNHQYFFLNKGSEVKRWEPKQKYENAASCQPLHHNRHKAGFIDTSAV